MGSQQKRMVLLADDDKEHVKSLTKIFGKENIETRLAIDTEHTISLIEEIQPSIILTDIDKADYQFEKIAEALQSKLQHTSFKLIVFCNDYDEEKEVKAFNMGAFDFLSKPLKKYAFEKRLEKMYLPENNFNLNKSSQIKSGDIILQPAYNTVIYRDKKIILQQRSFDLLYLLVTNKSHVFTREELLERIWHDNEEVSVRSVDVHILKIRKKLSTHLIKTIKGIGYRYDE